MRRTALAALVAPAAVSAMFTVVCCGSSDSGDAGGGPDGSTAPPPGPTPGPPPPPPGGDDAGGDGASDGGGDAGTGVGLDPTFGTGGYVVTAMRDGSNSLGSVIVQPDGKLVAIGIDLSLPEHPVLFRLTAAGARDTTFGFNGAITLPENNTSGTMLVRQSDGKIITMYGLDRVDTAGAIDKTWTKPSFAFGMQAIAMQPDDKLLAGGNRLGNPFGSGVSRVTTTGALDTTFGTAGTTKISSTNDDVLAITVDAMGRIVVLSDQSTQLAVTRLTSAGALDATFGTGGVVTTALRDDGFSGIYFKGRALAVQADGKVLVAGRGLAGAGAANNQCVVARYDAAGVLDTTFDGDGYTSDTCSYGVDSNALKVDGAGNIVLLRSSAGLDTLVRFDSTGALDTTFGGSGHVQPGGHNSVDIAIQSDGKIVTAGALQRTPDARSGELARATSAGVADGTFGTTGVVDITTFASVDRVRAVTVLADGSILAAGQAAVEDPIGHEFALAKYTPAGALDATFGTGGKAFLDAPNSEASARGIGVDSMGRIVVGGGRPFAAARFLASGAVDTTFGTSGQTYFQPISGSVRSTAYASVLDASDRIVLAGEGNAVGGAEHAVLARLTTTGALDATFATGGVFASTTSSWYDTFLAVALQPDGKIVASGAQGPINQPSLVLERFTDTGALDGTFTQTDGSGPLVGRAVCVLADGRIVVAGMTIPPATGLYPDESDAVGTGTLAMSRFSATGVLDTTFGTSGLLTVDLGGGKTKGTILAVREIAGKLWIAGTNAGTGFVARLSSTGAVDKLATAPATPATDILAIAPQPDGKIVGGGTYLSNPTGDDFLLLRVP